MNVRMVDAAVESIGEVDVVGVVVDASESTGAGTRYLVDLVRDTKLPTVLILNKVDLVSKKRLLPLIDEFQQGAGLDPHRAGVGPDRGERRTAGAGAARLAAGRGAALSGRLPHRSAGARARRRDGARAGAAPDARGAAVFDGRDGGSVRGGEGRQAAADLLHDFRRARFTEAHRHRPRRRSDQADRHHRAAGDREVLPDQGVSGSARRREGAMARRRTAARQPGLPRRGHRWRQFRGPDPCLLSPSRTHGAAVRDVSGIVRGSVREVAITPQEHTHPHHISTGKDVRRGGSCPFRP